MASNDTIQKTIMVAVSLCFVCALIVSTAAVSLKPLQEANKSQDMKQNILAAAGMLVEDVSIDEQFAKVKTRVVDMRTGKFSDEVDAASYDPIKAAKDVNASDKLTGEEDIAKIFRREHYSLIYLVESDSGLDKIILPVRGYGLWGTLYGFIALENDANTVAGIGFYDHKETPGLGGEVDNPRWKAVWSGKEIYSNGAPTLKLIKGTVNPASEAAKYQIDGLSGATLTSKGVTNLLHYWLGDGGFKPFLNNLKSGEA